MRSFFVLLATVALSHAHFYTPDGEGGARALTSSRFFRRNKGIGSIDAKDVCKIKVLPEWVTTQVLNTTDLSYCQGRLLNWANDPTSMIQNTGDGPGLQITYNTVSCQVCNFGAEQHVDPNNLITLFTAIHRCGTQDAPQMGFGYSDNEDDNGYYVSYAPAGHLQTCYAHKHDHHGKDGLENSD